MIINYNSFLFALMLIMNAIIAPIVLAEPLVVESNPAEASHQEDKQKQDKKPQKWWKKRIDKEDLYYPHEVHMQAMDEEGDSCMLCHTFAKNSVHDKQQLKAITTIANEPMMAICHDCHLDDLRAPWRCNICHLDKTKIWPDDHNYDYIHQHSEDARLDEKQCRTCHLDLDFCSNCHFRRGGAEQDYHPMGYQSKHGIDVRIMASQCARCHNASFCTDCHRYKK